MINYIKSPATALTIIFATSGSIEAQGMSISSQGWYSNETTNSILHNNSNNNDSYKIGRSGLSMCFPMVAHGLDNYIGSVDDVIEQIENTLTPNQIEKAEQKQRAKKALALLGIVGFAGLYLRAFLD